MEKIKNWFHNYWYYYKWYTVVFFAVLLIVIICAVQCSTGVDYDLYMTYASHSPIMNTLNPIRDAVKETLTEEQKETVQNIAIRDMIYINSEKAKEYLKNDLFYSPEQNSDVVRTLQTELIAGDSYIYLLDKELFAIYEKSGVFAKLTDIFDKVPDIAYGEYGILFSQTELYRANACFQNWGDDVILCLKAEQSDSAIGTLRGREKQIRTYNLHKDVFIGMVNYIAPDETE